MKTKTEFLESCQSAFDGVLNEVKNGEGKNKALIVIACEMFDDEERKGKHSSFVAMCGQGRPLAEALTDAMDNKESGELIEEVFMRYTLCKAVKKLAKDI